LGIDREKYKDKNQNRYSYPLETAAIIIAFYLFPPRTKDTLPMQVMQGRLKEVSGDQLLDFFGLASRISLILFGALSSGLQGKDGKSLYVENAAGLISTYWEEHKGKVAEGDDKHHFDNVYYSENSDRFNELVMYGNIKADEDRLKKELADMVDRFTKRLFAYRENRDPLDLLDALNLVDIQAHLNELDVHTAICTYSNKMAAYSKKLEDVITVWKRIVTSQEWGEIKTPLVSKGGIFALLTVYFDHPHNLFYSVYEAIRLENP
jgi:hypothetical protein